MNAFYAGEMYSFGSGGDGFAICTKIWISSNVFDLM